MTKTLYEEWQRVWKVKSFEWNIVYSWSNRVSNMLVWFLFFIICISWHIIHFTINYWKIVVLCTIKWFVISKEIHDTNGICNFKIVITIWDTLCSYFLTEAYRHFLLRMQCMLNIFQSTTLLSKYSWCCFCMHLAMNLFCAKNIIFFDLLLVYIQPDLLFNRH